MSFILPYDSEDSFNELTELSKQTKEYQFFTDANTLDAISLCKKYSLLPANKLVDMEINNICNIEDRFGMSYFD